MTFKDEVASIEMKLQCTMQCLNITRGEAHEWRMKHDPEYREQIAESGNVNEENVVLNNNGNR